ncbi:hypothetical protein FGO68_gene4639 [Halteria grandinella]|uniref:Peroxin-12 n=1 Tax=Halteria grandinella TaxID=5974 RepID=A0A8J8NJT2_HALGN|nr:hypothetical protein FGO68_gene4639 [Halteria grandinella]
MDQIKTIAGQRISFFELVPQNELQKYFRQGVAYLVNIFTSHYDALTSLRYYTHEIALVFELLIQSFYLLRKQATYSEFFFGFKRSVRDGQFLKTLGYKQVLVSLICEVLLPYLKHRLLKAFEPGEKLEKYVKLRKFIKITCYMVEMSLFSYQFRYLVDSKAQYFKPYLRISGILVRRMNHFEQRQASMQEGGSLVLRMFQQYNIFLLFLFMKYCEWHFRNNTTNNTSHQNAGQQQSLVPPPAKQQISKKGECPLCKRDLRNASVLDQSGVAFCYQCIADYVNEHGVCPITRVRATMSNIRKVFV